MFHNTICHSKLAASLEIRLRKAPVWFSDPNALAFQITVHTFMLNKSLCICSPQAIAISKAMSSNNHSAKEET